MKVLDERVWSARKAEADTGINHAGSAGIRRVKTGRFSLERLTGILGALGQEVELSVQVRPRAPAFAPVAAEA